MLHKAIGNLARRGAKSRPQGIFLPFSIHFELKNKSPHPLQACLPFKTAAWGKASERKFRMFRTKTGFWASKSCLALEFVALFGALPCLYWRFGYRTMMLPALWIIAALLTWALCRDNSFDKASLHCFSIGKAERGPISGQSHSLGLAVNILSTAD